MAVRQYKDGRWIAYWREPGTGKQRKRYFGRGAAAEAEARKFHQEVLQRRQARKKPAAVGPTLAEIAIDYARRPKFNANSRACLLHRLTANVLPLLGHRPAAALCERDLDIYVHERRRPRRVSNHKRETVVGYATIRRELNDIIAMLSWAKSRRLIPSNPLRGYRKPDHEPPGIIPPSGDEAAAILAHASDHLRRAIILSWYTGLRPGAVELLTLTWSAWRSDAGYLRVTSAHKGGPARRDVPVHPSLAAHLAEWRRADTDTDNGRHDSRYNNCHIIRYNNRPIRSIKRTWHATLRRAGIDRPLRPYDVRHHFITAALAAGADIKALAEIVGSSPETLRRHYQHVSAAQHRQTVALVPDLSIQCMPKKQQGRPASDRP